MAEEIRNISLSNKKSFSIDGDINRIIQIDTSDMNILVRMEEVYEDMEKLAVEAQERLAKPDDEGEDSDAILSEFTATLKDIDKKMREKMDYIFASPIIDICEPTGNMYDPVGGEFRFEHIIDTLSKLYANDITSEFKKMQAKVKKHTEKYTNNNGRRKRK